MKPSRTRDRVLTAVYAVAIAAGVVILILGDGGTRFAAVLIIFVATIDLGLAVHRLRHHPY